MTEPESGKVFQESGIAVLRIASCLFMEDYAMKKPRLAQILLTFSLLLPTAVLAASFSSLVAFGDSLTDTGRLYKLSSGSIPPSPPYYQGRASNGPLWIDYVASDLHLSVENLAMGGAKTGNDNLFDNIVPGTEGLLEEVDTFRNSHSAADPNALYTIWAGADNFLPENNSLPSQSSMAILQAVNDLTTAMSDLNALGARQFLVFNMPDFGLTPRAREAELSTPATEISASFNTAFNQALNGWLALHPENTLIQLDTFKLLNEVVANPSSFGFTNVTDACLNIQALSLCNNPNQFLFWDDVHGTTATHRIIADRVLAVAPEIDAAAAPMALTILAGGLLLLGERSRRFRQSDRGCDSK
jgi:phospholipase/lecithinase/hemolysin